MAKAEAVDLPAMKGPGVELKKIKRLETIGGKMEEQMKIRSDAAEELTNLDKQATEVMTEEGIKTYRYNDMEMYLKEGKTHVKIRAYKPDDDESDD